MQDQSPNDKIKFIHKNDHQTAAFLWLIPPFILILTATIIYIAVNKTILLPKPPPKPINNSVITYPPSPTSPPTPTTYEVPADTSKWKLYTNNTYGYTIKYPPDAVMETENTDNVESIVLMNPQQDEIYMFIAAYQASTLVTSPSVNTRITGSIRDWITDIAQPLPDIIIRSTTIDNHDAAIIEAAENYGDIVMYIKKDPDTIIQINSTPHKNTKTKETFDLILSTFKFTN
jgi:hypothetical protein